MGVELARPVMTAEALGANFTKEGGVFGTTRFLKNVMGLWLLQECQRMWKRTGHVTDYDTLLADVEAVAPFTAIIDPDNARFLAPADMLSAINTYLVEHEQRPLSAPSSFARCIMESLVLRYHEVFYSISRQTDAKMQAVHVLGGGARNIHLNQWLADALGIPVIAGPYEATALGNALMQLVGLGDLHTLEEVRAVAQKTATRVFEPQASMYAIWKEEAQRFSTMTAI